MKPSSDPGTRLTGGFLFLLGAGLGYWQILTPIRQAMQHAAYIDYYIEAVALTPLALLFGLYLVVFGAKGSEFLSKPPSRLVLVLFLAATLVIVLASILGMGPIMKGLGYS